MFASFILDSLTDGIFDDDRVWQQELLLMEVGDFRLRSVALVLEKALLVESVVDRLDMLFDRNDDSTLRLFILRVDSFVKVFI